MKVLHVIPSLSVRRGGPSYAVLEMARALSGMGFRPEIATTIDTAGGLSAARDWQGPTHVFQRTFPRRYGASRHLSTWLKRYADSYDLLHIHSIFSVCSLSAGRIAAAHDVPYIVRPHGSLDTPDLKKKGLAKKILGTSAIRQHLARSAGVHCATPREASRLVTYGAHPKTFVSPLLVPPIRYRRDLGDRMREAWGVPLDQPVVLAMARFDPKKRLEYILIAANACSRPCTIVLAGAGSRRYGRRLRELASQASPQVRVLFPGFLEGDEKVGAYAAASVFAMPSQYENFGIAAVEALSTGLHVIASCGVYVGDLLQHLPGFSVTAQSEDAFSSALIDFIDDWDHDRAVLDRDGVMAACHSQFGEAAAAASLLGMYRTALSGKEND